MWCCMVVVRRSHIEKNNVILFNSCQVISSKKNVISPNDCQAMSCRNYIAILLSSRQVMSCKKKWYQLEVARWCHIKKTTLISPNGCQATSHNKNSGILPGSDKVMSCRKKQCNITYHISHVKWRVLSPLLNPLEGSTM
jgi:hypothetical protein